MAQSVLSVIDTTGIQDYIFGSNRLAENIGASQLVEMATDKWVKELVTSEDIVYRGGGNVMFRSASIEQAHKVITALSRKLLIEAPGLEIAVAHKEYNVETDVVGGKDGIYNQLMRELAYSKQQRPVSAPLLGVGVTLACRSTGLPATELDEDRPVSADIDAKVRGRIQKAANTRLIENLLPTEITEDDYQFSTRMDELGRTEGESSYIAVVHADGNGMGKRFKAMVEQYPNANQNEECLKAIKVLSDAVEQAGKDALQQTVAHMLHTFIHPQEQWENESIQFITGIEVSGKTEKPYLPFRPLVYGGDDVTFVCDGRLGLTLAATYLAEFEKAAQNLPDGKPAHASAGVAIVKSHYPFARAYDLAEQLCKSAKKEIKLRDIEDTSMLDWHIAASGVLDSLEGIRQREYMASDGFLYARPLTLHRKTEGAGIWRSWEDMSRLIEAFNKGVAWDDKRNKAKALREALREGTNATQRFLTMYALKELPELDPKVPSLQTYGWDGNRCGYFDAIEAMDMYLPLTREEKGDA